MSKPIQKINKLFYGKWPYKIECRLTGAGLISALGEQRVRAWANRNGAPCYGTIPEKQQVIKFLDLLLPFLSKDIKLRGEGDRLNIFCMDATMKDTISAALVPYVYRTHGPRTQEELNFFLDNNRKTSLCNYLPHKKYQYKVYFKNSISIDLRKKFLVWVTSNHSNRTLISKSSIKWLNGNQSVQAPFMYVEDNKTLTMIGLFLGGNIKIEEFTLISSINTNQD